LGDVAPCDANTRHTVGLTFKDTAILEQAMQSDGVNILAVGQAVLARQLHPIPYHFRQSGRVRQNDILRSGHIIRAQFVRIKG
jgi:hypothetical protein